MTNDEADSNVRLVACHCSCSLPSESWKTGCSHEAASTIQRSAAGANVPACPPTLTSSHAPIRSSGKRTCSAPRPYSDALRFLGPVHPTWMGLSASLDRSLGAFPSLCRTSLSLTLLLLSQRPSMLHLPTYAPPSSSSQDSHTTRPRLCAHHVWRLDDVVYDGADGESAAETFCGWSRRSFIWEM